MDQLTVDHRTGRSAFLGELDSFVDAVEHLDDRALLTASRCHGWTALDVVVHVRTGLQEVLGGVLSPTTERPDRDSASYWSEFPAEAADDVDAILWTRRTSSAYRRPRGALEHLRMAAGTLHAAVSAMADGPVGFQAHVLRSGDLLTTWAVELAVHHLDLGDVAGHPPTAAAVRLGRRTVDALLGSPTPPRWEDTRCLLLGTGRAVASAAEAAECGRAPGALAVLG